MDMNERLRGCILLLAGAAAAWIGIYEPLVEATEKRPPTLTLFGSTPFFATVLTGLGLSYLLLGPKAAHYLGHPTRPSSLHWLLVIVLCVLGALLSIWFRAELRSMGYQV